MIEALILFGSHAREDSDALSDWDIISVVDHYKSAPYENKNLSISFYTRKFLMRLSEDGNLFALHVISEARPIYDPADLLGEMASRFVKKKDYKKEIADASMLGYFLLRHVGRVTNWKLFNKRAAWCVRTVLIALAYERGDVIFSSKKLSEFFHNIDADVIIRHKNSSYYAEETGYRLARFLRDFGLGDPNVYEVDNILQHIEYIFRSDNSVGKNTIASLFGAAHEDYVLYGNYKPR